MSSDEEAFNRCIVVESEQTKRPRAKREQIEKINAFMKAQDDLWENLTVELNYMGPPEHSGPEWKRVWSVYKQNAKRARTSKDLESAESLDEPTAATSHQLSVDDDVDNKDGTMTMMHEILEKLNIIIQCLSESNGLLKLIATKP